MDEYIEKVSFVKKFIRLSQIYIEYIFFGNNLKSRHRIRFCKDFWGLCFRIAVFEFKRL